MNASKYVSNEYIKEVIGDDQIKPGLTNFIDIIHKFIKRYCEHEHKPLYLLIDFYQLQHSDTCILKSLVSLAR